MTLPSVWASYARMLVQRRPALAPAGSRIEGAVLEAKDVVPDPGALAAYRRVCAFPDDGALPATYGHALANPLHLALITGPLFPVRFLGIVHLANTIRVLRPLPAGEPLDLRCTVEGPRETDRGQEFALVTELRHDGELAWSEAALLLARKPGAGGGKKAPPPAPAEDPPPPLARWELPGDQGRRYARASGDWNPIHLSVPTARLFGFRQPIMHGMWSLARCVAELGAPEGAFTIETAFKLPVLLPAAVTLHATREGSRMKFALKDGEGVKPHLTGTLGPG